jgi:hypothetical protein
MAGPSARGTQVGASSVVAAAFLLASCSYNPRRPAANWSAFDTRNVRVYTSTHVEHEFAQEWLETAFSAYRASFFKDLRVHPVEAMFLQVEPGAATRFFLPTDDPPVAWALESMPGGGRIGKEGLIVLTDRRDFRGASKQVALQLIAQAIPHAPFWLRVGFAQYLSEYRLHYRGNQREKPWLVCYGTNKGFLPPTHFADTTGWLGGRAQTQRNVAGRDVLVPIDEVLDADWYKVSGESRYWFNFTAYALVSFLIHGQAGNENPGFHATRFPLLLQALAEGRSTDEALAFAYPHILPDELDGLVRRYVRSPARGMFLETTPDGLCFNIPSAAHAERKPAKSPVAEADVQDALDDLRRMPLWRKYGSWYPTDVLLSQSGKLERTPVPGRTAPPGEGTTPAATPAPTISAPALPPD